MLNNIIEIIIILRFEIIIKTNNNKTIVFKINNDLKLNERKQYAFFKNVN